MSEEKMQAAPTESLHEEFRMGPSGAYRESLIREIAEREAWPTNTLDSVLNRTIKVGMTKSQALCAWGYPSDTYESFDASVGTFDHWTYVTGYWINFREKAVSGWGRH